MDFFKKAVPSVISGDVVLDIGTTLRESSPKLLKMRRVSLLSLGQTIDEDDRDRVHSICSMYLFGILNVRKLWDQYTHPPHTPIGYGTLQCRRPYSDLVHGDLYCERASFF